MKAEALHVLCNQADPLTPTVFGVQMADSLRKFTIEEAWGLREVTYCAMKAAFQLSGLLCVYYSYYRITVTF